MGDYTKLPFVFLKFYFFELPLRCVSFYADVNKAFFQLFSLPLLFTTFFKPWKNEYRKEFVPVAIGIGMSVKATVISIVLLLFVFLFLFEVLSTLFIVWWPVLTIVILFLP